MSEIITESLDRSERRLREMAEPVARGVAPAAVTMELIAVALVALKHARRAHAAAVAIPESRPRARGRAITKMNAALLELGRAVLPIGIGLGCPEAVACMAGFKGLTTDGRN